MKLVVVTPAGRERYLRLLSHYVLRSPEVSEWQLWDNCRNEQGRTYLHALAATDPRCKLKQVEGADGGYQFIGSFFQYCDDPDALYLRLDDDIVFIEEGFFQKFLRRAEAERGHAIWFSPLVINNAVCNFLLKYFSAVKISGPMTCQAMCPFTWAFSSFPEALHPVFVEAARTGRLDAFRVPDREIRLSHFSINALGFFGSDKVALGDQFMPPGYRFEEVWLSSVLPAKVNRPGKIFGDLLVSHFSYHVQERRLLQTNILEAYYRLAGIEVPAYEKPNNTRRSISQLKRAPPYSVSL